MSLAKSTLQIYLPKKCAMVHTSDVSETLSCLFYLTFFKPLCWWFIMDDNCFQLLWFLLQHESLWPLASLPTLQLWHHHLSVETLLRSLISVVRDVNYFAAYMDSFRLALYDTLFRAFLGWTSLCFGPCPLFPPGNRSLVYPEIPHLGIPPSFGWCFCLARLPITAVISGILSIPEITALF